MDANGLSDSYCRVSIIPSNGGHVSIITNFDLCSNPMFTEFCQSVTYLESLFFVKKKNTKNTNSYLKVLIFVSYNTPNVDTFSCLLSAYSIIFSHTKAPQV